MLTPELLRVTAANFFFFLNFASFFLLPLFVMQLGGAETDVGAVMGTTGFASLLAMTQVGRFIDRFGARRFLITGAGGMALVALLFTSAQAIGPWLFLLRVAQGLCFACAFTATTSLAAQLAPPGQRAQVLGVFGLSTILTHAIAPALGEEVVQRFGFQALFVLAAACALVSLAIATTLPVGDASPTPHAARDAPLRSAHWLVAASTSLLGMGFGTVMSFIAVYVHSEGLGRAGVFFTAYTSTAILTRFSGAGLSDRVGRRAVLLPALIVLGASIFMIAVARDVTWLAVAGFFFGAAQGVGYPTLHALIVDLSLPAQLGRVQALFNGAFNLGVTVGSFAFGPIAHAFGYRPMFRLLAATPVLAALVLALGSALSKLSLTPSEQK